MTPLGFGHLDKAQCDGTGQEETLEIKSFFHYNQNVIASVWSQRSCQKIYFLQIEITVKKKKKSYDMNVCNRLFFLLLSTSTDTATKVQRGPLFLNFYNVYERQTMSYSII